MECALEDGKAAGDAGLSRRHGCEVQAGLVALCVWPLALDISSNTQSCDDHKCSSVPPVPAHRKAPDCFERQTRAGPVAMGCSPDRPTYHNTSIYSSPVRKLASSRVAA